MSKLTRRQNNLQKAQARFEKVSKRTKEFQLSFERRQKENGKFRTHAKIRRGEKEYHGNNRGLFHKAVNSRFRIKGDAPSITRAINSTEPSTFKSKALKKSAQVVNFAVHDTVKTAVDTGLAVETVGIKATDTASREIVNKARQKYTREAVDDYHRGSFSALRIGADAVKGTKQHFKLKKQYRLEKAKYKLKKADKKLFAEAEYKPKNKNNKTRLKANKAEFKEHKANFKNGSQSNIQKAFLLRRTQKFKQAKRELKFEKKQLKTDKHFKKIALSNQKKIKTNSNPGFLAAKPVKYTGNRMKASAWQKAVNEDADNDVLHAIDLTKRRIVAPAVQKVSKPERLQRQQKKRDKISDKETKKHGRLRKEDSRLKEKHDKPQKKKKAKNKKKHQSSYAERFKAAMKEFLNFVKNIFEGEAKKFFAVVAAFILILLLVFAFILMIFSSITSGGGFTLGTYAAQDYDLSEAEKYYTGLAWDMNQNILMVGNSKDWKKGLKNLGVNTKDMKDNPDTWYWGNSTKYNWEPVYDFDTYKLWCFLCAYYYDFDSASNGDIKYWKFNGDTEKLIEEIFKAEYEFVYYYDNASRWEEYSPYHYWGGGNAETGTYYQCETAAYIYEGKPYRYRFKPKAYTAELSQFFDSEGYVCLNASYRVLNPNDNYALTGFYVMDNRYYSGTKEPFYYFDSANKQFFFMQGDTRYNRSFWGWDKEDAWFMVSPTDTTIWNYNITDSCMYGYYEKYYWKTDCRLYYNIKQKKTFDEVIEDKIKSMSHSDERIQYYNLLIGTDSGTMYGNHQTLRNMFGTSTIQDYSVVNGFGYDMQAWNTVHCDIDDLHDGVDFALNKGTKLYAPFDCEITDIDEDTHSIVLRKNDVQYWYDGSGGTNRDTEVYISNANLISGLEKDDTLKEGEYFATSTGHEYCDDEYDNNTGVDYVHIKVKIDTDGAGWDFIDPRLVLY